MSERCEVCLARLSEEGPLCPPCDERWEARYGNGGPIRDLVCSQCGNTNADLAILATDPYVCFRCEDNLSFARGAAWLG